MMNGPKYVTLNVDPLDFDYGGSNGSSSTQQENQHLYHGPQDKAYDPSAAPPVSHALGSYGASSAAAAGLHRSCEMQQQQQQQQQQSYLLGRINEYQTSSRNQSFLNHYLGASTYGGSHLSTAGSNSLQYQQHTTAPANGVGNPFDPLPVHIPVPPVSQGPSGSNPFDNFFINALANHAGGTAPSGNFGSGQCENSGTSGYISVPPSLPNGELNEAWLNDITLEVTTLSLKPLSGREILARLHLRMNDVISKFLPCVDFLVQCQQDLRKGLAIAQRKVGSSRRYLQQQMTPRQFFSTYVEPLPQRFLAKNRHIMDRKTLDDAVTGLDKLRIDAKASCDTSCEAVKNSFLGGMKEGESWGLRKWLSRHGNALAVCTDLECILKALKALDRSLESTNKLAELLRPIASSTLNRLKKDIPASYQERSSAHPYLPFFHRLESALRDMSNFDPNDDGVICLDDSDDESDVIIEVKPAPPKPVVAATKPRSKRKSPATSPATLPPKQQQSEPLAPAPIEANQRNYNDDDDGSSSGSDEECDIIEIVGVKQPVPEPASASPAPEWRCRFCTVSNPFISSACSGCGVENDSSNDGFDFDQLFSDKFPEEDAEESLPKEPPKKKRKGKKETGAKLMMDAFSISHVWPSPVSNEEIQVVVDAAVKLAGKLDELAQFFRENRDADVRPMILPRPSFWNGERYADVLSIFTSLLRHSESVHFVENVSEDRLMTAYPERHRYSHIIKNPLSLMDIALALLGDAFHDEYAGHGNGQLPRRSLESWNMWRGNDLLQALDLVLLNSLAYGKAIGEGRSRHRARTNDLRKFLWAQIQDVVAKHVGTDSEKKQLTPTRRSESSGFVVFKYKE